LIIWIYGEQLQHYNVKPIRLVLRPSYRLAAILAVAGLTACIIIACMPMLLSVKITICVPVVIFTAFFIVREALLCLPRSLIAVNLDSKGEMTVVNGTGVEMAVAILPDSFVSAYLTVLNLKPVAGACRRSLILTTDRVDREAFRQLRVWLRWGNGEPASAQDQNRTSAISAGPDF
jgi:toxin CptA